MQTQTCLSITTEIINPWIWRQNTEIKTPFSKIINNELPLRINNLSIIEPSLLNDNVIKAPSIQEAEYEKQAVKLIVIRKHKMRKHKLKKLRKKMKFEWAKVNLSFVLVCFFTNIILSFRSDNEEK